MMRFRTFVREPEALFWTFLFPILMALGLGVAFEEQPEQRVSVAIEQGSSAERWIAALRASPELDVRVLSADSAATELRKGNVGVVIAGRDNVVFRFDPARPESQLARLAADAAVQRAAGAQRPVRVEEAPESRPGSRYIDWVIPGLIGLNVMSTSLWGVGFGLVTMRQKKQLKRLAATPMRRSDFMLSQVLARLAFLVLEVPPIVLFAWLVFDVRVAGSILDLMLVVLLGTMAFSALGLLASSRARTIEGISGILNVIMLPMFVLSGVFFSASRFPDAMQPLVQALPLTALNDAIRAIYNDGLSIFATMGPIAILAGWAVVSLVASVRLFRWS